MPILRKDMQEGIGREIRTDGFEGKARRRFALHPQIDRRNRVPMGHHGIGEVELAIEFERPRLHGQGTGGRAGLGSLVDDADPDPELGQPERENQAGRSGADNQNVDASHFVLHSRCRARSQRAQIRSRVSFASLYCWSLQIWHSTGASIRRRMRERRALASPMGRS